MAKPKNVRKGCLRNKKLLKVKWIREMSRERTVMPRPQIKVDGRRKAADALVRTLARDSYWGEE